METYLLRKASEELFVLVLLENKSVDLIISLRSLSDLSSDWSSDCSSVLLELTSFSSRYTVKLWRTGHDVDIGH